MTHRQRQLKKRRALQRYRDLSYAVLSKDIPAGGRIMRYDRSFEVGKP